MCSSSPIQQYAALPTYEAMQRLSVPSRTGIIARMGFTGWRRA